MPGKPPLPNNMQHNLLELQCEVGCADSSPVVPLQDERGKRGESVGDGPADRGADSTCVAADGLPLIHSHPLVVVVHLKKRVV